MAGEEASAVTRLLEDASGPLSEEEAASIDACLQHAVKQGCGACAKPALQARLAAMLGRAARGVFHVLDNTIYILGVVRGACGCARCPVKAP
jgi:hypothetical protein